MTAAVAFILMTRFLSLFPQLLGLILPLASLCLRVPFNGSQDIFKGHLS